METIGFLILGVILAIVCIAILGVFAFRLYAIRNRGTLKLRTPARQIVRAHSIRAIAPLESKVIRFGLGSVNVPTFFVWRLWVQGDEIYLTFAPKGIPKLSLHSSGKWQIDVGHQRIKLAGPIRINSEWTGGPVLFFANLPHSQSTIMGDLSKLAGERKKVMWYEMPPVLHLAEFAVFIGSARLSSDALPPADGQVFAEQHAIGPLRLRNGRYVWLRYLKKQIPADSIGNLLHIRENLEIKGPSDFHAMILAVGSQNRINVIPKAAIADGAAAPER